MPVELNIVESTTELDTTVVEVNLVSASEPGPAGAGVPTGGTDGQVLTKTSATDYATAWEDPTGGGGGGAPTDVDYLVGTASGDLSAEIVVGTSPGGELGGTWASPTVDATHSGSSHAAVQAAAEATAAAALSSHASDTTGIHGISDTSALETTAGSQAKVDAHVNDATDAHDASAISIADSGGDFTATDVEGALAELQADHETDAQNLSDHIADSGGAHAASAISVDSTNLSGTGTDVQASLGELDNLLDDHSARHEDGGADELSIAGLAGIPTELQTHLDDTTAHSAANIPFTPAGTIASTNVQDAIEEVASEAGGGGGAAADDESLIRHMETLA